MMRAETTMDLDGHYAARRFCMCTKCISKVSILRCIHIFVTPISIAWKFAPISYLFRRIPYFVEDQYCFDLAQHVGWLIANIRRWLSVVLPNLCHCHIIGNRKGSSPESRFFVYQVNSSMHAFHFLCGLGDSSHKNVMLVFFNLPVHVSAAICWRPAHWHITGLYKNIFNTVGG